MPLCNYGAPLCRTRQLEWAYRRVPCMREQLVSEDKEYVWSVYGEMMRYPHRKEHHFKKKINHIGTSTFRERFFEFVRQERLDLLKELTPSSSPRREAEVPSSDSSDESDTEQQLAAGFDFEPRDHDYFSHVIIVFWWLKAKLCQVLDAPGLTPTQTVLLNLLRSNVRTSVRHLTNTFEERPNFLNDPLSFFRRLLHTLDYNTRKRFQLILNKTQKCPGHCRPDMLMRPESLEFWQGSQIKQKMTLEQYVRLQLQHEIEQGGNCDHMCENTPLLEERQLSINGEYFILGIPKPIEGTVTIGRQNVYNLEIDRRYRISALIKESDGLYTGWIRDGATFSYHHKSINTPNNPLPPDLTDVCVVIFERVY